MLPIVVGAKGELKDGRRQARHGGVHVGGPELIVERGEQQRGRLAADPGNGQENAGDDAVAGCPIGDHGDHLPHGRAQGRRRLAQAIRHQIQHVFRRPDDHGDPDHRQHDDAGPG